MNVIFPDIFSIISNNINPNNDPITFNNISSTSNTLPITDWVISIDRDIIKDINISYIKCFIFIYN